MFRVIVLRPQPTSPELQLAHSHRDVILYDILINLGIHFLLLNGKLSRPGPNAAKQLQIMMLPRPYLMISCWYVSLFLSHTRILPKQFYLCFICPQDIFPVVLWSVRVVFSKLQPCCNSFLCGVLPSIPCLFNVLHMADSWTEMLSSSNEPFKTLAVTLNLFFTLFSILCWAFAVILWREATVPNNFHLEKVCLETVDWWISKHFKITP